MIFFQIFLVARIVQGSLEFAIPHVITLDYKIVIILRTIQGGACGIIYALIGPMVQKHSFEKNFGFVVGATLAFFRFGNAFSILVMAEFCKFVDFSSIFYIVGGFTILVSFLFWFSVIKNGNRKGNEKRQMKIVQNFSVQQNAKEKIQSKKKWKFQSLRYFGGNWGALKNFPTGLKIFRIRFSNLRTNLKTILKWFQNCFRVSKIGKNQFKFGRKPVFGQLLRKFFFKLKLIHFIYQKIFQKINFKVHQKVLRNFRGFNKIFSSGKLLFFFY